MFDFKNLWKREAHSFQGQNLEMSVAEWEKYIYTVKCQNSLGFVHCALEKVGDIKTRSAICIVCLSVRLSQKL